MADDLYEARNSIYCYPGSDVLINKLNIKDNQLLSEAERKIVLTKSYELRKNSKIGNFDLDHFLKIHEFLFEDIYPFAGKFRNENIAKGYFSFAEWQYIEPEINRLFDKLKAENYLQGKSREELVKGLAYYLSELNVLHPFREGNGRTIREFIRELAFFNGYILDLQNTTSEELLKASVDSIADTKELEETLNRCLIKTDF